MMAPTGALGSLRPAALARGPGGAWRSRRVGVAQARGNCALVRNDGFRTRHPAAREEVQAAPGASVGWAQPDRPVYAPLSTISAKLGARTRPPGRSSRAGEHPMTGTGSAAESRPRAMAKLFNNAGDKPILPSILKPPIAMAKPAGSGVSQRTNLALWPSSSAAYDQAQHKPLSARRRRF